MKKISLSIFSVLLLFCFILAGCSQKKSEDALLWKISGNGLSQPSYVFGTHHLMDVGFLDSIPGYKQALEATEQYIGEIDASPQVLKETQEKISKAGVLSPESSYHNILSPEDYKKLCDGLFAAFGADTTNFEHLKPALISSAYFSRIYSLENSSYVLRKHEPIDFYLQRIAREKGKPVIGLETAEEQIALLFDRESLDKQAEMLVCCLENPDWIKKMIKDINSFYREKSLTKIYDFYSNSSVSPCSAYLARQFSMDRERNNEWMKKLPDMIKAKPSFIAIGALHLAGEDGLLSQLKKLGYTVEPVN